MNTDHAKMHQSKPIMPTRQSDGQAKNTKMVPKTTYL